MSVSILHFAPFEDDDIRFEIRNSIRPEYWNILTLYPLSSIEYKQIKIEF